MKIGRHAKIVDLISKYDIETQEELAERLAKEGYQVTQAHDFQRHPGTEADKDLYQRRAAEIRPDAEPWGGDE